MSELARMPMSPLMTWRSEEWRALAERLEHQMEAEGEAMKATAHGLMQFCPRDERRAAIAALSREYMNRTEHLRRELVRVYADGCTYQMILAREVAAKLEAGA